MIDFTDSALDNLFINIQSSYGFDFSGYSKASIVRRINRFLINNDIKDLQDLILKINYDPAFFDYFLAELTVNVTEMFRDPGFYSSLRTDVIKRLNTYPHIKVWDAGCSTGEETYSLAIILKEENVLHKTKIYATDVNQRVLAIARDGIYPLHLMQEYSRNYQRSNGQYPFSDYYLAKYNNAIFDTGLKENILFAVHNLACDATFNEFNLIVCRNVLIYFKKELQEKVIELFLKSLCIYGYLALGSKETLVLSRYYDHFEVINAKDKIYRRIK